MCLENGIFIQISFFDFNWIKPDIDKLNLNPWIKDKVHGLQTQMFVRHPGN